MANSQDKFDRRAFVANVARCASVLGIGGTAAWAALKDHTPESLRESNETRWQIDPDKCTACGNCETHCVLDLSAVKAMQFFKMCGYCDLCTGYFEPDPIDLSSGAENQLCPTGAIIRKFIEDPYYEYHIDEPLCIGCGKCVKGCNAFGNGSLYLQVRHDRCVNCNECAIAAACPSQAFIRLPASKPYVLRNQEPEA